MGYLSVIYLYMGGNTKYLQALKTYKTLVEEWLEDINHEDISPHWELEHNPFLQKYIVREKWLKPYPVSILCNIFVC